MIKDRKFKLPIHMIVLDMLGAVLAALGLMEWFTGLSFVPDAFKFEYYYIVMIVVGVILMIPMHIHIFKFVMGKNTSDSE
jgi:hypothetical protein